MAQSCARRRIARLLQIYLLVSAVLNEARAQSEDIMSAKGICNAHEVRFGANLETFQALSSVQLTPDEQQNMMRLPYIVLLGALRSLSPDAIATFFRTQRSVVGAADDFTRPTSADLGMTDSSSVYISRPILGHAEAFATQLQKATKTKMGAETVYSWQDIEDKKTAFFAVQLSDGSVSLSNDKVLLTRTVNEYYASDHEPCPAVIQNLSAQPYWLYREASNNHAIPLRDFKFRNQVGSLSLTIDASRRASFALNGKFGPNAPDEVSIGHVTLKLVEGSYVLTVNPPATGSPSYEGVAGANLSAGDLWAGLIGLFGFEIFM